MGWILQSLDSPIKRIGFCLLAVGLMVLIPGLFMLADDSQYLGDAWWGLMLGEDYYEEFWPLRVATFIVISGLLLSYLYDIGLGRIARWVKTGA